MTLGVSQIGISVQKSMNVSCRQGKLSISARGELNSQENYSLILVIFLKSIIKILLNSISVPFFLISVQTFQEIFGAPKTRNLGDALIYFRKNNKFEIQFFLLAKS